MRYQWGNGNQTLTTQHMTGHNERNGRRVSLAVALAAVMVVSMVAMGFVGTAAAQEPEIEDATINANPAVEDTNDNDLVAVVDLDLDGESEITFDDANDEITIDFDHDGTDGVDFSGLTGDGTDIAVDFVNEEGEVETAAGDGELDVTANNDEGLLTVQAAVEAINVDEIGSADEPAEFVRIAVINENVHFADNIDAADKEATISLDFESGTNLNVEQQDVALPLDGDAPIEVVDGAGEDRYSSFASAIADGVAGNDYTTVTVHEDVDEFEALTASVGDAATVDIGADEVTIEGADGQETVEFVNNDDSGIDEAVAFEDQEQITIGGLDGNGLDFQSSDVVNAHIDRAIDITVDTSSNLQDVNVENNTFTDFQGDTDAVIGIEEADQFVISGNEFHGTDYSGILVENTEFDTGDGSLEVDDNVFNDVGDGTAIDVTDNDDNAGTTIDENSISGLDGGSATGISVEADGDADTITIDNATIENNPDGDVGIEIAESTDPGATVNVEGSEAVIEEVDTGIDASGVTQGTSYSIEEVAFDSIGSTAVLLTGDYDNDITLSGVSVANSEDATGVVFDDGDTSLTLVDTQLGTGEDSTVQNGVDATGTIDALTVTDEDNQIWLADDGGKAIDVNDDSSGAITIQDLTVIGDADAPASHGVHIQDVGGDVQFDTGATDADASSISGVESGVVIEDAAGSGLDDIAWTEFDHIVTSALEIDIDDNIDGDKLQIDNVNVSLSGPTATGIDIEVSAGNDNIEIRDSVIEDVENGILVGGDGTGDVTVEQSEITVEDSSSAGLLIDDGGGGDQVGDITVEANEFNTEDSEASAILIEEEGSASNSIKFNDIVGFTDGYGLAGDDADDLTREEAIGNWWGSDFGPQHEDGSNVFVDVDGDADTSSVYDPFLTTNIEDTELDLDNPANDQVVSYANDIYIEEGDIGTVAFPSYSANELSEGEAYELIGGETADIVRYDQFNDDWVGAAEEDEIPEGLDAFVVMPEDTDVLIKVEYEDDDNVVRGDYTYGGGWNLAPTAASNDDIGTSDDIVTQSNTFDLMNEADGEFTSAFDSPGLQINPSSDIKTATDGDQLGSLTENEVSAFHPMWVYVEGDSVDTATNTAAFDPDADMQEMLDSIEQSSG